MVADSASGQKLLFFYCSFTCVYLPGMLILLKFNNNLYNVGTYKFMPILLIIIMAEIIKLSFSLLQTNQQVLVKNESRTNQKSRKSCSKIFKSIMKFFIGSCLLSAVYYTIIILFGAPVLSLQEETIMLTLTLITLTFIPACLHLGIDNALGLLFGIQANNGDIFAESIKTNVKFTLMGTWLGAIAIPLDWDRPWQAWPIPCITSALIGYTLAHFFTLIGMLPIMKQAKAKFYR